MQIVEISPTNAAYPKEWQGFPDKPQTVYAAGNVSLLHSRKFTVVGSRKTPKAALATGAQIAKELVSAFTLVSGAADGGDSAAIEGALESGKIICVLAGGFGAIPQGNFALLEKVSKKGLLLALHPHDTPIRVFSYEYRNKFLAALGEGTLVLGAGEKSGALTTAKYAQSFEKPVFALPYPPNSPVGTGCNALIKKGGYLTENSFDILSRFGINCIEKKPLPALTAEETQMLSALQELGEGHIAEIAARAGAPLFKARAVLSALQIKGVAVDLGGNRFSIT